MTDPADVDEDRPVGGDRVPGAEARAVAPSHGVRADAGRDHAHRCRHTVRVERVAHRGRRHDHPVELSRRFPSQSSRDPPTEAGRQERQVVLEVVLEVGVVGLDHRHPPPASEIDAGAMRRERGLDVDQIDLLDAAPRRRESALRVPSDPPDRTARESPPGARSGLRPARRSALLARVRCRLQGSPGRAAGRRRRAGRARGGKWRSKSRPR